jgi:hypothetical protein
MKCENIGVYKGSVHQVTVAYYNLIKTVIY